MAGGISTVGGVSLGKGVDADNLAGVKALSFGLGVSGPSGSAPNTSSAILMETSGYVLLESGSKILTE